MVSFIYTCFGVFTFTIFGPSRVLARVPAGIREYPEEMLRERRGGLRGRAPSWIGSGDHAVAARRSMSISPYDYFIYETKASYQSVRQISIPNAFVKRCLPYQGLTKVGCTVQDFRGREWPMMIRFNKKNGGALLNCYLAGGFKEFAVQHELPQNTIFTFELLTPQVPVIVKVHVFLK